MADLMAAALGGFLDRAARTPFVWGTFDCCLWLADWLVELGYPDPAADLRGAYDSALSCARLTRRHGGLVGVVAHCVAKIPLARTYQPAAGDIGVVQALTPDGRGMVGAICTGPRWAVLTGAGYAAFPGLPLAAWRT